MGAEGHSHQFGGMVFATDPIITTALSPGFQQHIDADRAGWELDAITRPKVWRHDDTQTWKPWIGHWFRRVVIAVGPICIDVCRCRCQECREYVADLRKRAGEGQ